MLLSLAFAAALLGTAPDTVPGTIRGSVVSDPAGVPLQFAVVQVTAHGRVLDTTTDSAGAYRLPGVPAGRGLLRVRHLDHDTLELEVLVPAGAELSLDFALKPRPIPLPAVVAQLPAQGGVSDTAMASNGDIAKVQQAVMESGPALTGGGIGGAGGGGNGGGQEPGDPRDVLYVRGSAADLKLVLLDGAPVYAPFHMGGLIHTFDPEALAGARLYLGGAPARYDGGLSYVLEMRTRAGRDERHRAAGAVDMVSARGLAEGPIAGGATYLATARGVHGALLSRLEGDPFPYAYRETLARVDVPLGGSSEVGFTGFANREGVRMDTAGVGDQFARWSNVAGVLRWRGPLGGAHAEATAALTRFRAHLPWHGRLPLVMGAEIERARLALDLAGDAWGARLRYGASYDRTRVRHDARLDEVPGEPLHLASASAGDAGGVYVDATWQPAPRLGVRAGLRGDVFSVGRTLSLSPRLSGTWLLSERAALTLAAGRYHQYLREDYAGNDAGAPAPVGRTENFADAMQLGTRLSVSRATHVSLALDQQLGEEVRLGLEGYFKHFEGLVSYERDRSYNSGMDVWVRGEHGRLSGWMGYSLAWSWTAEEDADFGEDRFTGRHLLSAGLSGEVRRATRIGVRVAYGAGLPFTAVYTSPGTPVDVATDPLSTPLPTTGSEELEGDRASSDPPLATTPDDPYVRVDAEISRTWKPRWAGGRAEFTPYLRVLNALDRRDALFYRYEGGGTRSVATLPFLPIAGFSFRF